MKVTAEQVAEYFRTLQPDQMDGNPAVTEAGRAFTRKQKRHAPGPGRPPTVEHKPGPKRPRNWANMSQLDRALWARKNGGKFCRCAECRRENLPSYTHAAYSGP